MVSNTPSNRLNLTEAFKLRQQAGELLDRLMADRDLSERRTAETGKRDPMKSVTGRTAMDSAIDSARQLITQMDALLEDMRDHVVDFVPTATQPAKPTRTSTRLTHKAMAKHETLIAAP